MARARLTVILVTHDDCIAARAQRVLRMRDGRLAADDLDMPERSTAPAG